MGGSQIYGNRLQGQLLVDGVNTCGERITDFGTGDVGVDELCHLLVENVQLVHLLPYIPMEGGEISNRGQIVGGDGLDRRGGDVGARSFGGGPSTVHRSTEQGSKRDGRGFIGDGGGGGLAVTLVFLPAIVGVGIVTVSHESGGEW